MTTNKNKFYAFPAATTSDWQQAASAELQGADPWKKLSHDIHGLTIKPFYNPEDAPTDSLRLKPALGSPLGPRTWHNCPYVAVTDPVRANAAALAHLEGGADGILFELSNVVDFKILLHKIDWTICSLNFLAMNGASEQAQLLSNYLKSFPGNAPGAWYGASGARLPNGRSFRRLGYTLPQTGGPAKSIADLFAAMIKENHLEEQSMDVAVMVELGPDFFLEISKLRALRLLWNRLLNTKNLPVQSLHIHGRSRAFSSQSYAPHENMICSTTTAMAAILGGCDALTVETAHAEKETEQLVARNTGILLREESRFAKVGDPLAGSYFIDRISTDLTDHAWDEFQKFSHP